MIKSILLEDLEQCWQETQEPVHDLLQQSSRPVHTPALAARSLESGIKISRCGLWQSPWGAHVPLLRVPKPEACLCPQCQLPADGHPARQQVMA